MNLIIKLISLFLVVLVCQTLANQYSSEQEEPSAISDSDSNEDADLIRLFDFIIENAGKSSLSSREQQPLYSSELYEAAPEKRNTRSKAFNPQTRWGKRSQKVPVHSRTIRFHPQTRWGK